jgi:hypothetical protein
MALCALFREVHPELREALPDDCTVEDIKKMGKAFGSELRKMTDVRRLG